MWLKAPRPPLRLKLVWCKAPRIGCRTIKAHTMIPSLVQDIAHTQTCPHGQEGNRLEKRMEHPLADDWHQERSRGIQNHPDDHHQDSMSEGKGI
ncbi:hypothetical protein BB8028_0009g01370 [Beauveria bassiana]|uniref:Uncharacterized protein n=1 Tax=Beauveria bassiana TaxID=176275 RepID=A0A2S7YPN2_BEABA|nr:hypothetical protein BB8028_0009g01370 [Beauveria bassiana]